MLAHTPSSFVRQRNKRKMKTKQREKIHVFAQANIFPQWNLLDGEVRDIKRRR